MQNTDTDNKVRARCHDLRKDPPKYELYVNDQWIEVDADTYRKSQDLQNNDRVLPTQG